MKHFWKRIGALPVDPDGKGIAPKCLQDKPESLQEHCHAANCQHPAAKNVLPRPHVEVLLKVLFCLVGNQEG